MTQEQISAEIKKVSLRCKRYLNYCKVYALSINGTIEDSEFYLDYTSAINELKTLRYMYQYYALEQATDNVLRVYCKQIGNDAKM